MNRISTARTLLGLSLLLTAGCKTMTGQTAGHSLDDSTITATVKTRLASGNRPGTLTHIGVKTLENTVYLSGIAPNIEEKVRAEVVAREVDGVKNVVNNIEIKP